MSHNKTGEYNMPTTKEEIKTALERQLSQIAARSAEYMEDFVKLYNLRNRVDLTEDQRNVMLGVLNIAKLGVKEGYLKEIDNFHRGVGPIIDRVLSERDSKVVTAPAPKAPKAPPSPKGKK